MAPYTLNWGIMATGHIAANFARDLLTDPAIRDAHDIRHRVVAVASSVSQQKALEFCTKVQFPPDSHVKTYGGYTQLVTDPDVSIVYIATPGSHHFQNAMLALSAGKHVLCENTLTVTKAQAEKLVATARETWLFLMEAVWTRFFPLAAKVQDTVQSGAIGTVYRVIADNSINRSMPDGSLDYTVGSRMVNPDLAGGAMLDLGVYSLTWILHVLYHSVEGEEPPAVISAAVNKHHSGIDESASFTLTFPRSVDLPSWLNDEGLATKAAPAVEVKYFTELTSRRRLPDR